jgi:hypothetical protein
MSRWERGEELPAKKYWEIMNTFGVDPKPKETEMILLAAPGTFVKNR